MLITVKIMNKIFQLDLEGDIKQVAESDADMSPAQ